MDTTYRVTQKGVFNIHSQRKNGEDLLTELQSIIYNYIRNRFSYQMDWQAFRSNGHEETGNRHFSIQTVICKGYGKDDDSTIWAMRIRFQDQNLYRRTWYLHVSVFTELPQKAKLYYAEMYCDYLAGSLTPLCAPHITTPGLFRSLIQSSSIICKTGQCPLTAGAILIDDAVVQDVITLIRDTERSIPIILIMCPDLLNPQITASQMLGNAIICVLDDYRIFQVMQAELWNILHLKWDTVQIIMPFGKDNSYHPMFTASEVANLGQQYILTMFRQAYCENMRAVEKRSFITVDDILRWQEREKISQMLNRFSTIEKLNTSLKEENERITNELDLVKKQCTDESKAQLTTEYDQLEALLDESMEKYETLKQGIIELTQKLYSCMGKGFQPDYNEEACLYDLQHAIFVCFARLGGNV